MSLLLVSAVVTSCKKKSADEEATPEEIPTTPTDQICNGNGKNSYFPLDLGNKWSYSYKFNGGAQPDVNYTITGDTTIKGKSYRKLNLDGYNAATYNREDAVTHDIYIYDVAQGKELLRVPGSPKLNQVLESPTAGNTEKVTNLSAAFTTGACTYTDLLEISELDNTGKVTGVVRYKKGLGFVQGSTTLPYTTDLQLKSTTLK